MERVNKIEVMTAVYAFLAAFTLQILVVSVLLPAWFISTYAAPAPSTCPPRFAASGRQS